MDYLKYPNHSSHCQPAGTSPLPSQHTTTLTHTAHHAFWYLSLTWTHPTLLHPSPLPFPHSLRILPPWFTWPWYSELSSLSLSSHHTTPHLTPPIPSPIPTLTSNSAPLVHVTLVQWIVITDLMWASCTGWQCHRTTQTAVSNTKHSHIQKLHQRTASVLFLAQSFLFSFFHSSSFTSQPIYSLTAELQTCLQVDDPAHEEEVWPFLLCHYSLWKVRHRKYSHSCLAVQLVFKFFILLLKIFCECQSDKSGVPTKVN
jgi:hypothetical protein